jgi:hypothetical protein
MPFLGFSVSKDPDDYRDRSPRIPRGEPIARAPRLVWLLGWGAGVGAGALVAASADDDLLSVIGSTSILGALIADAAWRWRWRRRRGG